jgi:hypothetical protein
MPRPSKLTEKQWAEVEKRVVSGEKIRALAREYKVSEGAIRARVGTQAKEIKEVAHQMVAAEQRFKALSVSAQVSARNLANDLIAISDHLASAGKYGAMTAHRLSGIAHGKVEEIDDAYPLTEQSLESLKGIAVLTKMANASSEIGLNLLRANKEAVEGINRDNDKPEPKQIVFTITDASA